MAKQTIGGIVLDMLSEALSTAPKSFENAQVQVTLFGPGLKTRGRTFGPGAGPRFLNELSKDQGKLAKVKAAIEAALA